MEATNRALSVARQNMVRGDTIYVDNPTVVDLTNQYPKGTILNGGKVRSIEATGGPTWLRVEILPAVDSQKVRVWVRRNGVGTFFGGHPGQAVRQRDREVGRVGQQRRADRQLPEAVPDSRHVVRER